MMAGVDRRQSALAPVAHDEIHIQEPALDFLSTRTNYLHSRITKGDGRDTRQSGEALLSPGVDNIRSPSCFSRCLPVMSLHTITNIPASFAIRHKVFASPNM